MKAFVLAGLATLMPAAAFPGAASAETTGSLVGRVRDAAGMPVADAIVIVSSPAHVTRTVTGPYGCYSFVDLIPGTYAVTIARAGFVTMTQAGVAVAAGNQAVVNLQMAKRARAIARLTDYASSYPVNSGQTADVYRISWDNPLFANVQNIDQLLQFVPGVRFRSLRSG